MTYIHQTAAPFSRPIDRRIFGHFIESGFGRQVAGLWAEMLFNRAFRDVKPYTYYTWEWLGFEAPLYNQNAPFWHSGYEEHDWQLSGENVVREHTIGNSTYKGKTSTMLKNPDGVHASFSQGGLHFKAGQSYSFKLMAGVRGSLGDAGLNGFGTAAHSHSTRPIRIRFVDESGAAISETSFQLGTVQHQHEHSFTAANDCTCTLSIEFDWQGTLMLSCASLMPDDNMDGWRRDAVEKFRKLKPPVVRFPGGCFVSFYDWESTIGPRDAREPQDSYYWGGLEENDAGLDEFMRLSELCGFEPQLCFNMMTSTPFKARQLVEYLNANADTGMGRLRKLNGRGEPYGVRLFEMDNEPDRKWTAEQYANQCASFAREMRLADPLIELMMACYTYPLEALPGMLEIAGADVDYVIYRNGEPDFVPKALELIRQYNDESGRSIKLVNTEWLPSCSSPEPFDNAGIPTDFHWHGKITNNYDTVFSTHQISWNYALNLAHRLLDYMSYGPDFVLANFNNCCNTWGQNVLESTKREAFLSCAGEVFALFGDTFEMGCAVPTESGDPLVKAQLIASADCVRLYIVNHASVPKQVRLPEGEWGIAGGLTAPNRMSHQTAANKVVQHLDSGAVSGEFVLAPLCVLCLVSK